jgi:chromate transporter
MIKHNDTVQNLHTLSYSNIALAFLKIGLLGFGGVAISAHRVIVEERRWLNDGEYAALLGLGQALPGANTVNLAVMLGDRAKGWRGALLAVTCLMSAPVAILAAALAAYDKIALLDAVQGALNGVASAAAGLIWAVALKMLRGVGSTPFPVLLVAATFIPVGVFAAPLGPTLLIAGAAGVALSYLRRGASA